MGLSGWLGGWFGGQGGWHGRDGWAVGAPHKTRLGSVGMVGMTWGLGVSGRAGMRCKLFAPHKFIGKSGLVRASGRLGLGCPGGSGKIRLVGCPPSCPGLGPALGLAGPGAGPGNPHFRK